MTDTTIADPFATGPDEADEFDTPQTEFVEIADLDGRLVLVLPHRLEQATSRTNGDKYDRIVADVIVLDGPTTEKITEVPGTVKDMFLSSTGVVSRTRRNVGSGRPVLGRVDSRPSTANKRVLAYGLADPSDADKVLARPAWAAYKAAMFG